MRLAISAGWVVWGMFLVAPAFGQQPKVERGCEQREVQAISISLKTGWRGKKEVNETYGPPPGFVIVEHRVDLKKKDGNVNYSVSILPDKFTGITAQEVKTAYSTLADTAAKLHLVEYQAKLNLEKQDLLKRFEMKSVSSGVIAVKASIDGSGELDFVVFAKIARAATNVSLGEIHRLHMENMERLAANPKCKDLKDVLCSEQAWLCQEAAVCENPANSEPPWRGLIAISASSSPQPAIVIPSAPVVVPAHPAVMPR